MTEPTSPPFAVSTSALSKYDKSLLDNFAKDIAAQSTRLDDLAKQLITLNIAIPGLYATVLKFISGDEAVVNDPVLLLITFTAWLLALGFALASLFPQRYQVDPDSLSEIETFFYRSAQRKRKWLAAASLLSFFGICFTVFSLFV
ncbi:MAG: hypothetical protein ACK4RS_03605 [Thiothrix sp.]